MTDPRDWKAAAAHLSKMKERYAELLKVPGVNPCFALGAISEIERRYESGERSDDLFAAMMSIE